MSGNPERRETAAGVFLMDSDLADRLDLTDLVEGTSTGYDNGSLMQIKTKEWKVSGKVVGWTISQNQAVLVLEVPMSTMKIYSKILKSVYDFPILVEIGKELTGLITCLSASITIAGEPVLLSLSLKDIQQEKSTYSQKKAPHGKNT